MTTILVYKENGIVYLGADGSFTAGYHALQSNENKIVTLFSTLNGDDTNLMVASACSHRLAQVIEFGIKFPKPPVHKDVPPIDWYNTLRKYVITDFCTALKEGIEKLGGGDKEAPGNIDGNMILVIDNDYFVIEPDYQVACPSTKFYAIAYSDIAIGVLEALETHTNLKPEEKILEALRITSKHIVACRPPFSVLRSDFVPCIIKYPNPYTNKQNCKALYTTKNARWKM